MADITLEALQYDLDSLYAGIEKIDNNIALLEKAINDERQQKGRFQQMAAVLEVKKETGDGVVRR
jgi:CHASE3 domain sensor protein